MANKIPVKNLYGYLEQMLTERWGYIYGTAGVLWTEQKQSQLESKYSSDDPNYGMSVRYGKKWIGHMVSDCSGVMVYIWKQFGLSIPHGSTSMVRQGYIIDCSSTPHPGYAALVDPTLDTPDNKHIGIVGEDGVTVYEAKGTQYGFVTSKVTDAKWTKFGRFKDVNYEDGGEEPMPDTGIIKYYAEVDTQKSPLSVRNGPGTEYAKIGSLPKGTEVAVMTEAGDWAYIMSDSINGYCSLKYLKKTREPEPEPSPEPSTDDEWLENITLTNESGSYIHLSGRWRITQN